MLPRRCLGLLGCCLPLLAGACPPVTRVGISDLGLAAYRDGTTIRGTSVDIVNELARRTGCKVDYVWLPRARLFMEMETGHIDMTMGAVRQAERDAYASFYPYAYVQYDLLLLRRADQHFTGLTDFVQRGSGRLNLTRGFKYPAAIDALLNTLTAQGRVEEVNSFETVFSKLEMGRADGTLATAQIYAKYLSPDQLRHQISVIPLPEVEAQFSGIYLSHRSLSAADRLRFGKALKAMVADQSIISIYHRYFDEATVKRLFRAGPAPLLAALAAQLATATP